MAARPAPATRDRFAAFRTLQTRWMDNDIYGHMNNVVHYSLFDTAVNGWMLEQGVLDPRKGDSYGLVVETGCKYHAEIAFPQVVTAGLVVTHLGTSSVRFEIGLFADDAQQAAAEGFFVHVHVSRGAHRPVPISGKLSAALSSLMKED